MRDTDTRTWSTTSVIGRLVYIKPEIGSTFSTVRGNEVMWEGYEVFCLFYMEFFCKAITKIEYLIYYYMIVNLAPK